jgi:hypothetical protein
MTLNVSTAAVRVDGLSRPVRIPDRLPRLDVAPALAVVELPLEGSPADILAYVDGALLVVMATLDRFTDGYPCPTVRPPPNCERSRRPGDRN